MGAGGKVGEAAAREGEGGGRTVRCAKGVGGAVDGAGKAAVAVAAHRGGGGGTPAAVAAVVEGEGGGGAGGR